MESERKHNWFTIDGDFRTNKEMTTIEFSDLLDKIYETFGVEFIGGHIGFSPTTDENYK